MKPLGQKPHRSNYVDCHPPKGFRNWWESEGCTENKAEDRRNWKKQVQAEVSDAFPV